MQHRMGKMNQTKIVFSFLWTCLKEFYSLLKYIFTDQMKRKDFFTSLLSDYIALVLIAFGGFAFVCLALINWVLFLLFILFLALFSTLRYFKKLKQ